MANITQDIRIETSRDKVFDALTTQSGYAAWWTKTCEVGDDEAEFVFDGGDMKVRFRFDERAANQVRLTCVGNHNNPEWQDTTLLFELGNDNDGTTLHFVHDKWQKEGTKTYNMCVGGWEFFIASLKSYLETGDGTPHDK